MLYISSSDSKGFLGYQKMSDEPAPMIESAVRASFEREAQAQETALRLRGAGKPHAPFRFRILFSDFVQIFTCVIKCSVVNLIICLVCLLF